MVYCQKTLLRAPHRPSAECRVGTGVSGKAVKCATWNCKILNHNFRFLLHLKFIERQTQTRFYGFNWNQFIYQRNTSVSLSRLCFTSTEVIPKLLKSKILLVDRITVQFYFWPSFECLPLRKWLIHFISFHFTDCRGLEILFDGIGSLLSLAVYVLLCVWHFRHHLPVALTLRHTRARRPAVQRDTPA